MSSTPTLRFARLTEKAIPPTRGSARAAGLDLYSACDTTVPARGRVSVPTDLQIRIPDGCYGRIAPRSGLALEHHIDVGGAVSDEDYRGNFAVILYNHSDEPFAVARGDRIAQLICERVCLPALEEVSALDATDRGEGGFGSTGKN
jgi:dUTP pyrophosphatase